ncbi:unnamed protein product [Gongylonema pulchrum]|uniref:Ig-like domain-containing protein n=1 Tax=Gongylonema pulchrum TaxID=637853 RepID=A0A183D3Z8_9BILA|nr:unnamed protein product [Gongylonema pulchrum]
MQELSKVFFFFTFLNFFRQPLQIECKIEGAPLTELAWFKDGERVVADDRIKIESDADGRARLVINPCKIDDEGMYRVIATNPVGSAHDKAHATVKKLPEDRIGGFIDGFFCQINYSCLLQLLKLFIVFSEKFDAYRAPRVVIPLESIRISEGNEFTLRCKFSGDPRPSIKWFKDGERVYSYERCSLASFFLLTETEDGTCELKVKSAGRFDGGGYRCVAENIYGSARTTCEVTVQLREKKPQRNFEEEIREGNAPGFSVPLTMKRAKLGDNVVMECVSYGNPSPEIRWLKDGIEIDSSNKIKVDFLCFSI